MGSHTAGQPDDGDAYSTGAVAAQVSMFAALQPTATLSGYQAVTAQNVSDMLCGGTVLAYLQVHLPVHCQRSKQQGVHVSCVHSVSPATDVEGCTHGFTLTHSLHAWHTLTTAAAAAATRHRHR